eukprot:Rhum_TRINITY_DN15303_c5_g1::Rhum_TRINITY_DN15303_c5_g1_i1::g.149937::m.149937
MRAATRSVALGARCRLQAGTGDAKWFSASGTTANAAKRPVTPRWRGRMMERKEKETSLQVPWNSKRWWTPRCCATHTQDALEYWCDVCRVPVCGKCWSHGEHVGHTTSLIPDVREALQQDLRDKAAQLDAEVARGSVRLAQLARLR